ncbi:MAG: 23S rRNA (adenine(2030)-N(6))-methyltransferase RlmJ [Ectothiorhodospiraceae bacterium]|nr:23S rRNA (adenine(2030)-N(6))-methyltransferase RlmJ [Ectothiorhodospiraceae bacterium]
MMSYRHGFHAGNFADVLKHLVLVHCLRHLLRKDKPVLYLDTHAGAGLYALDSDYARKTGEYRSGIARLWQQDTMPTAVADYLALVRECNPADPLSRYPGSPWLAARLLRPCDRLLLHELHSSEHPLLTGQFADDSRVKVLPEDGYRGCIAAMPPPERRGLVLMDPSYELKSDYSQVVATLKQAHRRFATGVYAIWYPVVERRRIADLETTLKDSGISRILLAELGVSPDSMETGMTASGMIVVNPPYTLENDLRDSLPWLADTLVPAGDGHWRLETLVGERP